MDLVKKGGGRLLPQDVDDQKGHFKLENSLQFTFSKPHFVHLLASVCVSGRVKAKQMLKFRGSEGAQPPTFARDSRAPLT